MPRKTKATPEQIAAEAQAELDKKFLEQAAEEATPIEEALEPRDPTIADRFVQMGDLIVAMRQRTRLSESSLVKLLELSMNYHIYDENKRAQQAQQNFNPMDFFNPEEGEKVTEAEGPEIIEGDSNVIAVDFKQETEE